MNEVDSGRIQAIRAEIKLLESIDVGQPAEDLVVVDSQIFDEDLPELTSRIPRLNLDGRLFSIGVNHPIADENLAYPVLRLGHQRFFLATSSGSAA